MPLHPFDLEVLFTPGLIIFLMTLFISYKVSRSPGFSIVAAFFKAGMFLLYFGYLFDGTFSFRDDWKYLAGGSNLLALNVNLPNLVENWDLTLMVGEGQHFGYYLYNAYAFKLFGEGYYAPVALNILLTLVLTWVGTRLAAREFGFFRSWEQGFFAFLLFYPDIITWSNIMNGKDPLILLLHVLLLFSVSMFFRGQHLRAISLAAPVSTALVFLRFYVPLLFAFTFAAGLLLRQKHFNRLVLVLVVIFIVLLAACLPGVSLFQYSLARMQRDFVNPLFGFVRFLLTPVPFRMGDSYSFLNISASFHWIMMPFTTWGIVLLLRQKTPFSWFFLLYAFAFFGLYSVFAPLQGPRHRVQLDFALAVFQFLALKNFLLPVLQSRKPASYSPVLETEVRTQ
jgi:hypothetical protein